jgi:hypothetical protein
MITANRARRAAAILFVLTATLFAVGVAAEDDAHAAPAAESPATTAEQPSSESAEAHDEGAEEPGNEVEEGAEPEGAEAGHDESSGEETVFGIDAESPATVTIAVLTSITLAAGLWFTKRRAAAVGAVAVGVLFALFDIAEVIHQLDESRTGLAVLAVIVAVCHVGAATLAGRAAGSTPA